jgi:hypothetical protein
MLYMAFPGKYRQFAIIVIELFIVLKLYDWLHESMGISPGLFFVIGFVFFWLINWFLAKIQFGMPIQNTLIEKMTPRMSFSSEWFGIGIAASVILAFFVSKLIQSAFLVWIIILFLLIFAVRLIVRRDNPLHHSYGLLTLAFIFGLAFGNDYTNKTFLVVVFIIAMFVMYLTRETGEV